LDSRSGTSSGDLGREFSVVLSRFGAFFRRYGQRMVDYVDKIEGLVGEKGEVVLGVAINSLRIGRIKTVDVFVFGLSLPKQPWYIYCCQPVGCYLSRLINI